MVNNCIKWLMVVMMSFIVIMSGYFFYLIELDGVINPVITFADDDLVTDKTEYHYGETILLQWDFCKKRDSSAQVFDQFIDGVVFSTPTRYSNVAIGCYNNQRTAVVPASLPPGEYTMNQNLEYRVNAFKTIKYQLHSNKFFIKK